MSSKIEAYERQKQTGILLNANENSQPLSDEIVEEIKAAIGTVAFNRYPDNDQTELLQAYASVLGVKPENLLAGNGSDQMLGLLIGTFSGSGKVVYTDNPDFSMYDYYASAYEAKMKKFPLAQDGSFSISDFIDEGKKNNASLVIFSNPNNPTGHCLSINEIRTILEGFNPVPVVVDEAYIEFADEQSAVSLINQYANLYVTRTLSKAYGLAGVRVGFLISSQDNMDKIKPSAVPYALNSLSMKTAVVVLKHQNEVKASIQRIKENRERMFRAVSSFQTLHFEKSQANFLYGKCKDIEQLKKLFDQKNIRIRTYGNSEHFRITIGTSEENEAVYRVLSEYEDMEQ